MSGERAANIVIFGDDRTVEVVAGPSDAVVSYELEDASNGVVRFFDGRGVELLADPALADPPTSIWRVLTGKRTANYGFRRSELPSPESVLALLPRMVSLEPNPWFSDLDSLRRHFEGLR